MMAHHRCIEATTPSQCAISFCYTSESKTQDIELAIGINNNAECTEALYESSIILTSIICSLIAAEGF